MKLPDRPVHPLDRPNLVLVRLKPLRTDLCDITEMSSFVEFRADDESLRDFHRCLAFRTMDGNGADWKVTHPLNLALQVVAFNWLTIHSSQRFIALHGRVVH